LSELTHERALRRRRGRGGLPAAPGAARSRSPLRGEAPTDPRRGGAVVGGSERGAAGRAGRGGGKPQLSLAAGEARCPPGQAKGQVVRLAGRSLPEMLACAARGEFGGGASPACV